MFKILEAFKAAKSLGSMAVFACACELMLVSMCVGVCDNKMIISKVVPLSFV